MAGGKSTRSSSATGEGSGNDMNEMVRQLLLATQNLIQDRQFTVHQYHHPSSDIFKKVAQSKPPTYDGSADPKNLENWIREFEKLFKAIECPDESKVDNAAYYLRDQADLWWSQHSEKLSAQADFNWDKFTKALRDKLYPSFLKKKKAQEFNDLKMDEMSVDEYYQKFMELLRFVPDAATTEEQKAIRFEQGLTLGLQSQLAGDTFTSIEILYGKAAHLYEIEKMKLAEKEKSVGEKRKENTSNNNYQGNNFKRHNSGGNYQHNNGGNHGGNRGNSSRGVGGRIHKCKLCPNNHPGTDCHGNKVACNKCGRLGHRAYECFSKDVNGNQNRGNNGNQNRYNGNVQQNQNRFGNNHRSGYNNQNRGFQNNQNGNQDNRWQINRQQGQQHNNGANNNRASTNTQNASTPGKLYVMNGQEAANASNVVTGGDFIEGTF